jgi:hypothetical protein
MLADVPYNCPVPDQFLGECQVQNSLMPAVQQLRVRAA